MDETEPREQMPPWPDAAEAYRTQSTRTCEHGWLLWQACRPCGVGPFDPTPPDAETTP